MIERYEDFEVRIIQQGNQLYADLGTAPGGRNLTKPIPITLPPEDRVAWAEAKQGHKSEAKLAELGHLLFNTLITGELASNWDACLGEIRQRPNTGLRLRFSLQAEAMTEAPLELLCRRATPTREFLALDLLTPVVRSPRAGEPVHERPITLPLRMLVVMANPKLQEQFDPGAEQASLQKALADLIQARKLKIDYLGLTDPPNADYTTLQRTLAQTKPPYDVVHFIGHGALPDAHDEETEGILLFMDPRTRRRYDVRASDLAGILARNGVRIAVLQACDGACSGTHNAFQGVAQRLIAGGMPAVVAMQCPVDKDVATCFCGQFYHFWLAKGGLPLERAITEARQAVRQRFPERASAWWTPVLFIRLASTEVLKVDLTEIVTLGREKVLLRKYKIFKLLGSGALGDVYLAKDMILERKVAVKHLKSEYATDKEALKRFRREARTIAKLRHENIAVIYGLEQEDGQSYIIMEYAEKGTLADSLKKGPLPTTQAISLASAVCRALAAVHSRGAFHRDIKPSNILLTKSEGRIIPKLSDFGLSGISQSGLHGTLQYASPEQLSEEPGNAQSDIYSLGMVLYEMLIGRPPFIGSANEIIRAQLEEEPLPLRDLREEIPRSLEEVVLKALSKKPGDRYQTAQEMAEDLERARRMALETTHEQGSTALSQGNWDEAKEKFREILDIDAHYRDAADKLKEVEKQIHLRSLYTEARQLEEKQEWSEVIQKYNQIITIDPSYENAAQRLAEAENRKQLPFLYSQANVLFTDRNWQEAAEAFQQVLARDPKYKDAASKAEEAEKQARLQTLYAEGIECLDSGELQRAIDKFEEIHHLDSGYEAVDARLAQARKWQDLFDEGMEYRGRKGWHGAIKKFKQLLSEYPEYHIAAVLLEEAEQRLKQREKRPEPTEQGGALPLWENIVLATLAIAFFVGLAIIVTVNIAQVDVPQHIRVVLGICIALIGLGGFLAPKFLRGEADQ
jgi:serine/threonine protein kinase